MRIITGVFAEVPSLPVIVGGEFGTSDVRLPAFNRSPTPRSLYERRWDVTRGSLLIDDLCTTREDLRIQECLQHGHWEVRVTGNTEVYTVGVRVMSMTPEEFLSYLGLDPRDRIRWTSSPPEGTGVRKRSAVPRSPQWGGTRRTDGFRGTLPDR